MTTTAQDAGLTRDSGVLLSELHDNGVLLVTLNRPHAANALDRELIDSLSDLWRAVASGREVKCVVITGSGRAFCAGADIAMLAEPRSGLGDTALQELAFLPSGHHVEAPVITVINGACAGGGLHFAADADISIASRNARFLDPHVSVGQVSALEPLTLRLRMRSDALTRLVLLGSHERLDAEAALAAGLVSEVVDEAGALPRGLDLAGKIASNSPEAVRLSRRVLRTFEDRLLQTHLDLGWELIRRHREHPDALEGPRAFAEKRSPIWRDDA